MSGARAQAVSIALLSGGIYAVVLLVLQISGAAVLSGTAVPVEGAAGLLILLGFLPAVGGSAAALRRARGGDVAPRSRRLAATLGPPAFALLGAVLVIVTDVVFVPLREIVTVLIAGAGGRAGGVLGERVSRR